MVDLRITESEAEALAVLLKAEVEDGYLAHTPIRIAAWCSVKTKLAEARKRATDARP